MSLLTKGLLTPKKNRHAETIKYPALDPITQKALRVLDLPKIYNEAELRASIDKSANHFLSITDYYSLSPAESARRMAWTNIPDCLTRNDAKILIAKRLYRNHIGTEAYSIGGAEHDLYK